jgi:ubiquinone/menaquinone biosynthesis C-methylase UbiE
MGSATLWHSVYLPSASGPDESDEWICRQLLIRENRVYSDPELRRLPWVEKTHPHSGEWALKKSNSEKLVRQLESRNELLHILEIGCGNGWLSYQLSRIPGSRVIGLDTRLSELQQAARVFNSNSKLKFVYGDIRSGFFNDLRFDIIVMSSSIEYFPCLTEIIDAARALLYSGGELHILHSRFYKPRQLEKSKREADAYFKQIGVPEMSRLHHLHSMVALNEYRYQVFHNPNSIFHFLQRKKNPYWWVSFKKE